MRQAASELPVFVRAIDLERAGLSRGAAERVMREARPLIRIPGSRSAYAKRETIEQVLAAYEDHRA